MRSNTKEVSELYEITRRKILQHSTKITERVPLLETSEKRDKSITEIRREINTIKMYMGELYPHCSDRVRIVIDGLSEKGTILCGLMDIELLLKNRSAFLSWASLVNDLRLDIKRSPWDFLPGVTINLSLIHIDTGPSALKVGLS